MEVKILKALDFKVTPVSTAYTFLCRMLKAGRANERIRHMSLYLLDGTLLSYNLLEYFPSELAAAVVFIARRKEGRHGWSPTLLKYSSYCEEQVIPIARAILQEMANIRPHLNALRQKFRSTRYGRVSSTLFVCDF